MDSLASLRAGKSRLPLCGMVFCVWSVWFLWLRLVRPEREVRGRLNPRGSSQETPFSVPVPQKARVYTSWFFPEARAAGLLGGVRDKEPGRETVIFPWSFSSRRRFGVFGGCLEEAELGVG